MTYLCHNPFDLNAFPPWGGRGLTILVAIRSATRLDEVGQGCDTNHQSVRDFLRTCVCIPFRKPFQRPRRIKRDIDNPEVGHKIEHKQPVDQESDVQKHGDQISLGPDPGVHSPSFRRKTDEKVSYDAVTNGCFPLITNDPTMTGAEVLSAYRYHPNLERRNHLLKEPQEVAPVYLETAHRTECGTSVLSHPNRILAAVSSLRDSADTGRRLVHSSYQWISEDASPHGLQSMSLRICAPRSKAARLALAHVCHRSASWPKNCSSDAKP